MLTLEKNYLAFKSKLLSQPNYERKNDDMASTIEKMAGGIDQFKQTQGEAMAEVRKELDRLQTRMARPGAFTGSATESASFDEPISPPTREQRAAFAKMLRTGDRQQAIEARAVVNAGTSGQGLEAVAPWFDNVVLRMARDAAPLLKIIRTRKVGNFPAKHIVGNSKVMGSGWLGEQSSRTDTDAPLPLVVEVPAGEWYALPSVTEWALSDLNFDVEGWLRQELVDEYSETMQAAIVSGNGINKPTGFLGGPTPVTTGDGSRAFGTLQYYPTGQAGALPSTTQAMINLLLDVVHGTRWKHRQKAHWVMSALTMSSLRKFSDADGRPILLDSMITGQPTTLLGYPVAECESMPNIGANAIPIAFGDFESGYVLDEDSDGIRITRDDITQKGFVKFYARRRCGGKILDSDALKLIRVSAT